MQRCTSHNLYLLLEYEIEYLSNDFISISYSGIWIPTGNGIGFRGGDELYTINIDVQQGKIIQLSELLDDKSKVYELLVQDKFVCLNPPDNIELDGLFSLFSDTSKNMIKEEMLSDITKEPNQRRVQWYISGNDLVFGITDLRYLYKYSISLDEINDFLSADIVKRIKN